MVIKNLCYISFVFLTSCASKLDRDDLIGIFVNNHSSDTIITDANGTYKYSTVFNKKYLVNRGTWEFDSIGNEAQFHDFSFLTDTISMDGIVEPFVPKGEWHSKVRVRDSEIHLMYAEDSDNYYKRINSSP